MAASTREAADDRSRAASAAASVTSVTDPVGADLRVLLRRLRLGRLLDTLPERLTLARQNKLGHHDFLELVLADEVSRRDSQSAQLRARAAGLDPGMRLETWDGEAAVRYDRTLWSDLTSLRFVEAGNSALILGPVGVGKTHLACALGHIAIRRNMTVVMARADKLFKRLKACRLDNTLEAEMRRLARVDLLVLDDFALQPLDALETTDFYELVVERHRKASTLITSNREPAEWLALLAEPLLAQSAVDRLVSSAHELIVEGPSYRQRQKPRHDNESATSNGVSVDQTEGDDDAR